MSGLYIEPESECKLNLPIHNERELQGGRCREDRKRDRFG